MPLQDTPYNRERAVAYAHEWAFRRNPRYLDFTDMGGNCTNFASQCIHAGSGVMNHTPTMGWYYNSSYSRSPSWTGVEYLHNFLVSNRGPGPHGRITDPEGVAPGDIAQLSFDGNIFRHSPVIVAVTGTSEPLLDRILIAANTYDADWRPLSSYQFALIRFIHIDGVRKYG